MLGKESKQTPLFILLLPYIHSEDTTKQSFSILGEKKQVRLSTSYRYYRATYQTIVWVCGYCVLLAQACDRLRTTKSRANNCCQIQKCKPERKDI